ncbi:MAG: O-antigen ligase family protein [Chromatiales bacterium]|nr:O-antigen ligase family protein [Chromatiales bacterium]
MGLSSTQRDGISTIVAILFGFSLSVMLVGLGLAGGMRLFAVVCGVSVFILAAIVSGNPRLLILWALIFSLPMALSKHFGEIAYKGGGEQSFRIELYDIFVGLLLIFQLRDALAKKIEGLYIPRVIWFWIAIMLIGVMDIIQGPWRTYSAQELVRMAKVMLLFIVLVNELKTTGRFKQCIPPLAFGMILQSSVGIAQYLKGGLLGLEILGETTAHTITNLAKTSVEGAAVFRPSGLLLHANIFGIYQATVLPFLIGGFLLSRDFVYKAFLMSASLLGVVGLLLSQSRAAWVSFALEFMVLMALMLVHRRMVKRIVVAMVGATVAVAVVLVMYADKIIARLFHSKADATVGRDVFLGDFYRLISDHWLFGVGLNAYTMEVQPYLSFSIDVYDNWVPPVHNIYYLWWGETGIFGLALHLLLWVGIFLTAIKNLKIKNDVLFMFNAACLAAMVGFFFDGFLGFALRVNQPQRMYFLFAAFVFATYYWQIAQAKYQAKSAASQ